MILGIPREQAAGERRVALIPPHLAGLADPKVGFSILIQSGAGISAGFSDDDYVAAGARLVGSRDDLFREAEVIATVRASAEDSERLRNGQAVVGFADPLGSPRLVEDWARRGALLYAMELIPRITRAQGMDALSSMATIAGYKAVLLAASALPRIFPMLMTAAGTLAPARILVIGAGVAGLQAIATARRLGGIVHAYDVRAAAREQIESLGARFVDIGVAADAEGAGGYAKALGEEFYRKQREALGRAVADSDVVITTAAVPGARAPVLVTAEMLGAMRPGSVVVDLAAERGGNCEATRADEEVRAGGVTVLGPTNLPATVPFHASQMYSKNLSALLIHLVKVGALGATQGESGPDDEIAAGTLATRGGEVVHPAILDKLKATEG